MADDIKHNINEATQPGQEQEQEQEQGATNQKQKRKRKPSATQVAGVLHLLTQTQVKALNALMEYGTVAEAAAALKINRSTLDRWLGDPDFAQALQDARASLINQTVIKLTSKSQEAIGVLSDIMKDIKAPTGARVRAAIGLLDQFVKFTDLYGVESRLTELERKFANQQAGTGTGSGSTAATSPSISSEVVTNGRQQQQHSLDEGDKRT